MEEDVTTKTPAEELRRQIDYCIQILDHDDGPDVLSSPHIGISWLRSVR